MLYTYVPSAVKCKVFGIELKGLCKDNIVSIERQNPLYSFRKAQDGSQVAFSDSVPSYRVTIFVEQVSPSNEFLHIVFKLQEKVGLNLQMPITIEENGGTGTSFTALDCFFEAEPPTEFTSESGERQWSFICHNASYALRGTRDAGFIADSIQRVLRLIELSEAAGINLDNFEQVIKDSINQAQDYLKGLF